MATDHAHCDLSGHWKDKKRAKLLFVDVVVFVVIVIVVAMILVKIVRSLYIFKYIILKGQMLRNHGEVGVGGGCIALASMKRQKRNL